jgi:hypothetical protein
LSDCKWVNIKVNMDPLAIAQPRGFGAVQLLILGLMEHWACSFQQRMLFWL